jgi:drug/metabolite transporter (DMT)-like permease
VSVGVHAHVPRARPEDWLLLAILVVLWGSAFALTEIALQGFSPLQLVTGRLWIGAVFLLGLLALSRQRLPRDGRTWVYCLTMSVLGNVLPFFLISWGQQTIPSGLTGILMAIMPLVVLVLAHFLVPGERLNPPKVIGFLMGFTGIVLLTGPSALEGFGGNAAEIVAQLSVLAGAVCYGLNLIVARRGPRLPPQLTAGCVLLGSAAFSSAATLAVDDPLPSGFEAVPTAALLCLGLLSTGAATVIYYRVVARAGATFLSLINYLIPVYAVLAGAVFLGERLAGRSLLALAVILLGIVVSRRRQAREVVP